METRLPPSNVFLAGTESLVDAQGCSPDLLADLNTVEAVCRRIVDELELKVVGRPLWHKFPPPSGVTGLYLLSESHLACHTYPEARLATLNLYCCRPRMQWPWEARLAEMLQATSVSVRAYARQSMELSAQSIWPPPETR